MDPITLTYDVPVSRAAAFYLFVREIGVWWPSLQSIDPARYESTSIESNIGGSVSFHTGGSQHVWGEVVEITPPEVIAWRCWMRGDQRAPSLVTVRFFDSEWGARVVFEHAGWTEQNASVRARHGDWPLILAEYVSHARRHARGQNTVARAPRGVA